MTQEFLVQGMGCQGCVNSVKQALSELNKVESVEVDLTSGRVKIETEAPISEGELVKAVRDAGYTYQPLQV